MGTSRTYIAHRAVVRERARSNSIQSRREFQFSTRTRTHSLTRSLRECEWARPRPHLFGSIQFITQTRQKYIQIAAAYEEYEEKYTYTLCARLYVVRNNEEPCTQLYQHTVPMENYFIFFPHIRLSTSLFLCHRCWYFFLFYSCFFRQYDGRVVVSRKATENRQAQSGNREKVDGGEGGERLENWNFELHTKSQKVFPYFSFCVYVMYAERSRN